MRRVISRRSFVAGATAGTAAALDLQRASAAAPDAAQAGSADRPTQPVSYNETAKLGAILYSYTGNPNQLQVSTAAYKKLDQYNMLVDGVNTSREGLKPVTVLESQETCDITDYAWSVGYVVMATGQAEYSDKIERVCFNLNYAQGGHANRQSRSVDGLQS
jgi:hypothetical protein